MTFDAVFLSYDEPLADELYDRLVQTLGRPVKRLHGVRGMRRAYQLTAEMADTEQFLIADADLSIDPAFSLNTVELLPPTVSMRVWRTTNPVNGLSYGYGGLKLCRRTALQQLDPTAVDVLAGVPGRIEFAPAVVGDTRFDQSPYHAWRAGFRECAMLTRGCDYHATAPTDARIRLAAWTSLGEGPYAAEVQAGAVAGIAYAQVTGHNTMAWDRINDPEWLANRFAARAHPSTQP